MNVKKAKEFLATAKTVKKLTNAIKEANAMLRLISRNKKKSGGSFTLCLTHRTPGHYSDHYSITIPSTFAQKQLAPLIKAIKKEATDQLKAID